jgi:hypothetical protein
VVKERRTGKPRRSVASVMILPGRMMLAPNNRFGGPPGV